MSNEYTESEYWSSVASYAEHVIREALVGGELCDVVHELVDSSAWVIFTNPAKRVLDYSPNADAVFDSIGELEVDNWGSAFTLGAFYALERDVYDALDSVDLRSLDCEVAVWIVGHNGCLDSAVDALEYAGLYTIDRDALADAIVPAGCYLEFAEGLIYEFQDGDSEFCPEGFTPADCGDDRPLADGEPEFATGVRWSMPGCLDCGDWHTGDDDESSALFAYADAYVG